MSTTTNRNISQRYPVGKCGGGVKKHREIKGERRPRKNRRSNIIDRTKKNVVEAGQATVDRSNMKIKIGQNHKSSVHCA